MATLTCAELNMQHCKAAITHLALFTHENKIGILFIQEPYCLNGEPSLTSPPELQGILSFPHTHPRALLLIRTEIAQNFVLHTFSNSDNVIIATAINPPLYLTSSYLPPYNMLEKNFS